MATKRLAGNKSISYDASPYVVPARKHASGGVQWVTLQSVIMFVCDVDSQQELLDPAEVRRASEIEILDEVEEWELIMHHYCLVVAAKGEDTVARLSGNPVLSR
ncbi:unnamed protein product [Ectocarpus sp. 13 AM-2016]